MTTQNKTVLTIGISAAVLLGLYFVLKPKKSAAAQRTPIPPKPDENNEGCPPTYVRCSNYAKTKKCYNPLLVDRNGLNPNGTDPCAEPNSFLIDQYAYPEYSYYDYDTYYDRIPSTKMPKANPSEGLYLTIDDTIYG